jgi:hypothetical protein
VARVPEIVIDCHIEDVFAFMADLGHAPRWVAGVVGVRQVAGDGPGPGARYDVVRRVRGDLRGTAVACTGWEPPRRLSWREDAAEVSYALEPVWTATRVTAHGGTLRDLRRLCQVLEGREPRPGPLGTALAWLRRRGGR